MVLEAFVEAVQMMANADVLIWMMLGVFAGLIFGVIPGIGGITLCSLFLSFVFVLKPEQALPFMVAAMSCGFTGGSITAVLVGVPGDGPNAATVLDGYPMTQKGQGGRALGAALMASTLGNGVSAIVALAMVPLVLPMVFALRSAEMVIIFLIGISFIALLGKGSMFKGLISGALGLLIALIGFQAATGVARFTFDSSYLYNGIPLVPVVLGLFAVPEMVGLMVRGGSITRSKAVILGSREVIEGCKDVFRHWWLFLRSAVIGYVAGLIPGVGAQVAVFVAYGQAKQTSKHPEKFGTGIIEGVIAPESANNAKEGGALLTTFALGVPGSSIMAILLGAFVMLGIRPGPEMLTTRLPLSLNLLLVALVAGTIAGIICLLVAPSMARVALIPGRVLVPLVLVITFVGVYANQQDLYDIIALLVFSILGVVMRRFGYNTAALLLGYVLGELFEYYYFLALQSDGPMFFTRPISMGLLVATILFFGYRPIVSSIGRLFGKRPAKLSRSS